MWGAGGPGTPHPEKSLVDIYFLRNTGTDPPQEAIGPGVQGPIFSRGKSTGPSVKYFDFNKIKSFSFQKRH